MTGRTATTGENRHGDDMRAAVRAEATKTGAAISGWLEDLQASRIVGVPKATRGVHGFKRGHGGDYDELTLIHPLELARLRDNGWLETQEAGRNAQARAGVNSSGRFGDSCEDVLERIADRCPGVDPWERWLHATRLVDACNAVKRGRRPGTWATAVGYPWHREVCPILAADGVDVAGVLAGTADTGTDTDSTADGGWSGFLAEYLARLVCEAKRDYAQAYAAYLEGEAGLPDDPGAAWADKTRAKLERRWDAARARKAA